MNKKKKKTLKTNPFEIFKRDLKKQDYSYSEEWEISSSWYNENGDYDWMIEQIPTANRILEIGTGTGYSTIKLASISEKLICIEPNPYCISKTVEKLESLGIPYTHIKLHDLNFFINKYSRVFNPARKIDISSKVTLIESDILDFDKIINSLVRDGIELDTIVCWLIGASKSKGFDAQAMEENIKTPDHYRLKVQNTIFDHAKKILTNNGLINIVDRGENPSEANINLFRADLINSFIDQAADECYEVQEPAFREYTDAPQGGTGMILTIPINTPRVFTNTLAFHTVTTRFIKNNL